MASNENESMMFCHHDNHEVTNGRIICLDCGDSFLKEEFIED
jgi:hypothetical protein